MDQFPRFAVRKVAEVKSVASMDQLKDMGADPLSDLESTT